ncbi:MAG: GNAT family N-acetyltransferase, partial [Thermoplasmata archaeon]|nr:GNAT family N-acetyltransferase [Thermoplasmata archaeon]
MVLAIRGIDELPDELNPQLAALAWSDHDLPIDLATIRKARALGHPWTPYVGVVAIDDGQVLAQVIVERHRLTDGKTTEEIAGVTGVLTRPDALGRGLCTTLFEEVHRREAALGLRIAMLWTRRTWSAHRLYDKLGYRDVFSHPIALRKLGRSRPPSPRGRDGYTVRKAARRDADLLDALFERAHRTRLGFVPRFPHSFRTRFALGWRTPNSYHVLSHRSTPVGYFQASGG